MRLLRQSTASNVMAFLTSSADHVSGIAGASLMITASKDGAAFSSISPTVTDRGNGWYSIALTAGNTDTLGDLAIHIAASGADPADFYCRIVAGSIDADVSTRATAASVAAIPTNPLLAGDYTAPDNASIATILTRTDVATSTRLAGAAYTAPDNATIATVSTRLLLVEKILKNKLITDPVTGVMTLYDDDDATPLLSCNVFENADGSQAYRGRGAERRERLA